MKKGVAHILLPLIIILFAVCAVVVISINRNSAGSNLLVAFPASISNTPAAPTGVKYNELVYIDNFITPEPPTNHRSILKLIHPDIPSLKYVSHAKNIPNDWRTYSNKAFEFKYPSEIYPLEAGAQRIAFYESLEEVNSAKSCLEKYNSIYSDYCDLPLFVIYYASYGKENEKYGSIQHGHGWAAFYDLNNREWRAQTPYDPFSRQRIQFQTATTGQILAFDFRIEPSRKSQEKYIQNNREINYRDQVYFMISTFKLLDESKITNFEYKNDIETLLVTVTSPEDSGEYYESLYSDLDTALGTEYIVSSPGDYSISQTKLRDKTYYVNRYKGTVKPGEYKYMGVTYVVSNTDGSLTKFVADPKYCNTDSDCKIRTNFCAYGAYNDYHPYAPVFGCGPGTYEGIEYYSKIEAECGQSSFEVEYSRVSCQTNKCVALNPRVICK